MVEYLENTGNIVETTIVETSGNFLKEKKEILSEIDNEILREYSILNKYTTEKFSIILLILGFVGISATMWDPIKNHINLDEFLGLWILSTFVLLLIWIYSVVDTFNAVRKGSPGPTLTHEFIFKKTQELIDELKKIFDFEKLSNRINEEHLKKITPRIINYLFVNIDYIAKNTETRMRPISLSFLSLVFIGLVGFANYLSITPSFPYQSSVVLSIPLLWFIVIYAVILWILGFCWNQIFFFGKLLNKPLSFCLDQKSCKGPMRKIFGYSLIFVYGVATIFLIMFLFIFPFFAIYEMISYYLLTDITNIFAKFVLVMFLVWLFFKMFEILFSLHLIERIKNDKITWLKQIKFDLVTKDNDDLGIIGDAKERMKLADMYSPVPYTSLAAFTRYEIIPIYRNDVTSDATQKRLEFLNRH